MYVQSLVVFARSISRILVPIIAVGIFTRLAAAEGALLSKSLPAGGPITATGAFSNQGAIYFGTRRTSYQSSATLSVLSGGTFSNIAVAGDDVDSTPTIGSNGAIYFGSWDGKMRAVKGDGTPVWTFNTGTFVVSSAALAADGTLYFGAGDHRLYALTASGSEKWSFQTSDWISSSPAIANDGTIYVGGWNGSFYAVKPTGVQKWAYSAGAPIVSSPAIGSTGNVYVCTRAGKLLGFQSEGTKVLEIATGGTVEAGPIVGPGAVYIATLEGNIIATNANGIAWHTSLGAPVYQNPVLRSDGSLLVCAGQHLFCLRSDGSISWSTAIGAAAEASPVIGTDGKIYVGALDGRVYIFSGAVSAAASAWPQFHRSSQRNGLGAAPLSNTANTFEPSVATTLVSNSPSTSPTSTTPSNSIPASSGVDAEAASSLIQAASPTLSASAAAPTASVASTTADAVNPGRIINLSARAFVGTGENVAIAGFIVHGTGKKSLLVRGLGPALANFNVKGALAVPRLDLYTGTTPLLSLGAWNNDPQVINVSDRLGAFALDPHSSDGAAVLDLAPAGYTMVTSGANGSTGIALLEVYDADGSSASSARLSNISCRAFVGTGDQVLIGGVCIGGASPVTILVRVLGPALIKSGVTSVLADPTAEVHATINGQDEILARNDDWNESTNADAIRNATATLGVAPLPEGSLDSAFLLTLAPGGYTIIARGQNGSTGVALLELYSVD